MKSRTLSAYPSLFSHGYLKWHEKADFLSPPDKIMHMLPSFFFVLYSRNLFKTLTNLPPSLKFYGKLGCEINASSSCRVSGGLILHTWNLPGNLNYGLGSAGGCASLQGESIATRIKTLPQNWLQNNSEDEWMTWSQRRPPRYIEEGFSSHHHLLIRNRCTESFINMKFYLLYILIVCQCLTIR